MQGHLNVSKSSQVVYISLFSTHWMAFVGHRTTQQHFNHIHHKIFSKDEGKKKKKKRKRKPSWTYLIHCCQTNTNFFLNCQRARRREKLLHIAVQQETKTWSPNKNKNVTRSPVPFGVRELRSFLASFASSAKQEKHNFKMVINLKIGSPSIKAPGLTHFPHRMGVVAMVAVTMTSAPDAASSTVEQAFAPISLANFCALAKVLLHTLTFKDI